MAKAEAALSMPALVKALQPGETYARAKRVPVGSPDAANLNTIASKLRNVVNQTVSKARGETGNNFRVETGIVLTDDRQAHIVTVAATRFEDEDDDDVDI